MLGTSRSVHCVLPIGTSAIESGDTGASWGLATTYLVTVVATLPHDTKETARCLGLFAGCTGRPFGITRVRCQRSTKRTGVRPKKGSKVVSVISLTLILSSCGLVSTWTETAHDWAVTGMNDNSLTLVVAVGSSRCERLEGMELTETATEVTITAVVSEKDARQGIFGTDCTADLVVETVEVGLERPLGNRSLTGCAPGDSGLEDYFGHIYGGRTGEDCAEIIGWR